MTAHRTGTCWYSPPRTMKNASLKSCVTQQSNQIAQNWGMIFLRASNAKKSTRQKAHRQATSQPILARTWTPAPFTTMTRKPANLTPIKNREKPWRKPWKTPLPGRVSTASGSSSSSVSRPARYGVNSAALPDKWSVTPHHRSAWTMTTLTPFWPPLTWGVLPPTSTVRAACSFHATCT